MGELTFAPTAEYRHCCNHQQYRKPFQRLMVQWPLFAEGHLKRRITALQKENDRL
ncbi:hypothetical protein BKA93DRAFT_813474 [Sparassis latifolia]